MEGSEKRIAVTTMHLVWGRDGDQERQHPCTEHGSKGTLWILPQCSVFLRESVVELRLASSLRGPNPIILPPPVTTSSFSSLHPHPPPILLSVNNSDFGQAGINRFWRGAEKTLVLFCFPFSLEFWCLNLKKNNMYKYINIYI